MKIVSLTDIHGDYEAISKMAAVLKEVDLILVTGDITHFGHRDTAKKVVETIREINPNLLAVTGNCDHSDVEDYLNDENLSINGKGKTIEGLGIMGVGASLPTPFNTPNEMPESAFETCLYQAKAELPDALPFILVSHQPPFGTLTDRLSSGVQVGSQTVRTFIERFNPLVCFSGHIHEARGKDRIVSTVIINPGPASAGNYAWVEIIEGRVETVEIKRHNL